MISLALLILIGAYIGLFVLAWKKNKTWRGRMTWWAILLAPLVYVTWDIPVGYYQFQQACKKDGGLKVFEKPEVVRELKLGKGLDRYEAESILRKYSSLRIIEAQDVSKNDEYFLFKKNEKGEINQMPLSDSLQASFVIERESKDQGIRLEKVRWVLKRINGQEIAAYTHFSYSLSNPEHTLFGRSGGPSCYQYGEGNPLPYIPLISLIAK